MQQFGELLLVPGSTGTTPLFLSHRDKNAIESYIVHQKEATLVWVWFFFLGTGLEPFYMQQFGELLLVPGSTGTTPLFLSHRDKNAIESYIVHQKETTLVWVWFFFLGTGLEPFYMQQFGELLLVPGSAGTTPLFLSHRDKNAIESYIVRGMHHTIRVWFLLPYNQVHFIGLNILYTIHGRKKKFPYDSLRKEVTGMS